MVNRVVRVYLLPFVTVGIGEGPRPASLTSPRRGPCGVIETGRTVSPHRFTMYLSSLLTALLAGPVTRDARVSAIPIPSLSLGTGILPSAGIDCVGNCVCVPVQDVAAGVGGK